MNDRSRRSRIFTGAHGNDFMAFWWARHFARGENPCRALMGRYGVSRPSSVRRITMA